MLLLFYGADYETRSARFRARRHARGRRNSPRLFLCFATAFSSPAILINAKKKHRSASSFLWSGLRDSLGSLSRSPTRTRPPKQPPAVSLLRNGLFEPRNPNKHKKRSTEVLLLFYGADYETRSARFRARRHARGRRNSPRLFLCFATAFSSLAILISTKKEAPKCFFFFMERITRLELATSTLARWRSTG